MVPIITRTVAADPLFTAAEIRQSLRINNQIEDALLVRYEKAARDLFEETTGIAVGYSSYVEVVPYAERVRVSRRPFVDSPGDNFYLRESPATSGVEASANWDIIGSFRIDANIGEYIFLRRPESLATVPGHNLKLHYDAGHMYESLPEPIRVALLQLIGHWYRNREAFTEGPDLKEVPLGFQRVVDLYDSGRTRGF